MKKCIKNASKMHHLDQTTLNPKATRDVLIKNFKPNERFFPET